MTGKKVFFSLIDCDKMETLIESAIINDINPEEYLSSIFELAAATTGWTDSNWSKLLSWNIKLIKKSDVSTVKIA